MNNLTPLLADIARRHLSIETLAIRKSDSLDFHTVSVWGVESALREAYERGANEAKSEAAPASSP